VSSEDSAWTDPQQATTVAQLVRAAAHAYGDRPAIRFTDEQLPPETVSFADLDRRSAELARGLLARGIGKGSRVGFVFANGPSFAVWMAAIARIGGVAVPISTLIKANELVRVLRQSDVQGLVLQRSQLGHDYAQRIVEALPELGETSNPDLRIAKVPYLRWVACSGPDLPPTIHGPDWFSEAATTVSEELLHEAEKEVHATDQFVEIYTSGSMALPKGVKHLHGPTLFRGKYIAGIANFSPEKEQNAILPMFWIGGLMMSLMPNWVAGGLTLCGESTMRNSQTAMGSVVPPEVLKLMSQQPKPWWGLGMSETLGPYSFGDDFRAEGWPVCAPMDNWADGYEVRIADENDQPVGDGETGELQIRGYPVTPGLHKLEREGYYTADGYYKTGDMCLVEHRPNGKVRVHYTGRSGDMIKTASSNVSPAEVEMEMQDLPQIHSAYVVGLPDEQRGQIVAAAAVAREGQSPLDFTAIEAELRKRMSGYKVPRAYIEITRDEVPLLHSNKVSKRMVAELLGERLGRPAS